MFSFSAVLATLVLLLQASHPTEMPATAVKQMTTEEHTAKPGWWPRKGDAPRSEYAGSASCAECHSTLVSSQQQHAMARSASFVKDVPSTTGPLNFVQGSAHYWIGAENKNLTYRVQYDSQFFSAPLEWVFGSGHRGQTFLYRRAGEYWETRVTLFKGFGLDITPGESRDLPFSFTGALGRWIPAKELPECFGCHTTAATTENKFNPTTAIPGISCEGCHGPGSAHVALAHAGIGTNPGMVFNPARLDPASSLDFCGSCHRTWWDVSQLDNPGIKVVRFPAYRLEESRCWGNGDARLTCVACHNPHAPLLVEASQYDQKCISCHVQSANVKRSAERPGAACPVKTSNCTSCHMPKYELPETHSRFTDHRIRVVRDPGKTPEQWN